jgi:hypothetical protein
LKTSFSEKILLYNHNIKKIIVHCSDTSDKQYLTAADIHLMHLGFGWDGIGYHKVILRDGIIEDGRPLFWRGAHTYGLNNESLGICLIGQTHFDTKQFLSLKTLLLKWKEIYPDATILGHRDAINTKKTCPNFNVNKWCKQENIF